MVQAWNNKDNLYLKYGPDKATAKKSGEFRGNGLLREWHVKLTLSELTQTETIIDDTVTIPSGYRIQEVEVITETAAATGTAIDVGLSRRATAGATTLTEVDYDGLLAAFPTAQMNVDGERHIMVDSVTVPTGATGTGALIGTTTASTAMISASMTDATSFTAGVLHIIIRGYKP